MMKIRDSFIFLFTALALASCTVCQDDNAFREKMASLDWGTDVCYVYGHKTPDVDAVCSSLAYASLMRSLGYDCEARVSSPINNDTKFISDYFGFSVPQLQSSIAPGTRLIATDHEEYAQSVDGARDAVLLQIIDHHQEGDMASPSVPFVVREMIGSTCTIIWNLYSEADVQINDETAKILLSGILSDTDNLAKANTVKKDTLAWEGLTKQLGLSPEKVAEIWQGMADAHSDYDGMTDYEIFVSDYKDYDLSGERVGIGNVEWTKDGKPEDLMKRMLAVMPEVQSKMDRTMLFLIVRCNDCSYFLYYGDGTKEAAEALYGESESEGICFSEKRLSRKTDVVPALTEYLEKLVRK